MGCSHSTRTVTDPLPPPHPITNPTTHAYGTSPRPSSSPNTTKPTQPPKPTLPHPRATSTPNPPPTTTTTTIPPPPKTRPTPPKLPKTKSHPEMVNLRTADQALTSPSQVAYPSTAYILGLTRKKQQQQEAEARMDALRKKGGVGAAEEEEEEENEKEEVSKPAEVIYLSQEREIRALTAKRADASSSSAPLSDSGLFAPRRRAGSCEYGGTGAVGWPGRRGSICSVGGVGGGLWMDCSG